MAIRDRLRPTVALRRRSRVYLHIGAMKTGTTFLQEVMSANRESLAEAGFLFPGRSWIEQDRAARDVLGFSTDDSRLGGESAGMWEKLTTEIASHHGKASIYSMEFLSFADAERAARVVGSFPGAEVHVVLTVRDAARAIPAQWQTTCRNGGKVPWPRFIRGVRELMDSGEPDSKATRMIDRTQGIPRMLEVWAPLVGPKQVHVVTVPPSGSDPGLLWERFAKVVRVSPEVAPLRGESMNTSLGHASTELLRRVNVGLGPVRQQSDYNRVVKSRLARGVLGSRAHLEKPILLHRRGLTLAARWNETVRAAIDQCGVRVVGDLDVDLPTRRPAPETETTLRLPSDQEIIEAAATARDGLVELEAELRAELAGDDPAAAPRVTEPTRASHWSDVGDAVAEVTLRVRTCIDLEGEIDVSEPVAAGESDGTP